ncbi:major histocompatibility complex class I-related gene protein-like isoform X1 [Echeneis naucrates]|uniref:major histocompatibility complex class I-related gene protein-like isoform X1 n=1 Tax=Echeneis naucrates TaxID=173247 RepID=UPI0011142B5F|nr:major histocompatibility complex class I-related gene protein-like isoform X1 [Echeneis naucrates]
MEKLLLLLLFGHISEAEKHSLKFFATVSSGVSNVPEFIAAAQVDDVAAGYCDSNTKTIQPKQDWVTDYFKDNSQQQLWFDKQCSVNQPQILKTILHYFMQIFRHDKGVVLQLRSGCEWSETSGQVAGFMKFGFDGEDFISFDMSTLTWIALQPQAVSVKQRWDADRAVTEANRNLYYQICPTLLKTTLTYGKSSLLRTDRPSVSLLQKSSSSPVSCFATGFYPNKAVLFWRKDGDDLHDNVEEGQILPNPDGTFQKSSDLDLSSVRPEDWGKYECVFQLSGLNDDIITKLDQSGIRTNSVPVPPSEFPVGPVVGGVVGLLLLTACICGLLIWRRRVHGYQRGSRAETVLH